MKIHTLQAWEEIVGLLEKAAENAGGTIVNIAGVQCFLPNFPRNLHADLLKLVGAHIGILRLTDGYRIRILNKNSPESRAASTRPYAIGRPKRAF